MKKRLWRLGLASVLLAAAFTIAPTPITPVQEVAAIDPANCTLNDSDSFGVVWTRTSTQVGSAFSGVRVLIVARALEPCLYVSPYSGKAFELASYQGTIGGSTNVAQIGLMKFSVDNQTYFGWTAQADGSGVISKATWVDFDNNGSMDTPTAGRSYIFDIQRQSYQAQGCSLCYRFRFGVKDTVTGQWEYGYRNYAGGYKGSNYWTGTVWWGCEAGPNNASNIGSGDGATYRSYIQEAQYEKATDATWYYTSGGTGFNTAPFGWNPLYSNQHWQKDAGGAFGSDRLWCWGT